MESSRIQQIIDIVTNVKLNKKDKEALRREMTDLFHGSVELDEQSLRAVVNALNQTLMSVGKGIKIDDLLGLSGDEQWKRLGQIAANDFVEAFNQSFKGIGVEQLDVIADKLSDISDKLTKSTKSAAQKGLKDVKELDAAISRLGVNYKDIEESLSFDNTKGKKVKKKNVLDAQYQSLQDVLKTPDVSWEKKYQEIVKYIKAFEGYKAGLGQVNPKLDFKDSDYKEYLAYEKLYQEWINTYNGAKNSLQNIINRREEKALVGFSESNEPWAKESTLQEVKSILQGGLKVTSDANNSDTKPSKSLPEQKTESQPKSESKPKSQTNVETKLAKAADLFVDIVTSSVEQYLNQIIDKYQQDLDVALSNRNLKDSDLIAITNGVYEELLPRLKGSVNPEDIRYQLDQFEAGDIDVKELGSYLFDKIQASPFQSTNSKYEESGKSFNESGREQINESSLKNILGDIVYKVQIAKDVNDDSATDNKVIELLNALITNGKNERGAFLNSRTGDYIGLVSGGKHSIDTVTLGDYMDAAKNKYDTRIHYHTGKIAAPSADNSDGQGSDFHTWVKVFDHIKQQMILTQNELLAFDFSSLTREQLEAIRDTYEAEVIKLKANTTDDEMLQVQMRQSLEQIMKPYAGVMTAYKVPDAVSSALIEKTSGATTTVNASIDSSSLITAFESATSDLAKDQTINDAKEAIVSALSGGTATNEPKVDKATQQQIRQETGNQAQRYERLEDIASNYEDVDDIEAAIKQFGEVYKQIVLMSDDGFKYIKPNKSGINTLSKIATGDFDFTDYSGIEFQRVDKPSTITTRATIDSTEITNVIRENAVDTSDLAKEVTVGEVRDNLKTVADKLSAPDADNEHSTMVSGTVNVVSPAEGNQIAQESTLQEIKNALTSYGADDDSEKSEPETQQNDGQKIRTAIMQELAKYGTFDDALKAGGKRIQFDGSDVHFGSFVSDYLDQFLGQSFDRGIYEDLWKEAREQFYKFEPVELTKEDAINIIREKMPENLLEGWFRKGDSEYKSKIESVTMSDDELRNAALNIMWSNFKEFSGKDIGFKEFLNSEIPVYRGKNSEKYVNGDELLAFSFDENMAKKFGNHILETLIKPIDTLGAFQTTAEAETLVYRKQLEDRSEYQQWHNNMAGVSSAEDTSEAIQKSEKVIAVQKQWLKYLDGVLDDNNFKTSGKKAATEQLRSATRNLVNYRMHPEEYSGEAYAEEKRIVAWNKAYQEAQNQGVAQRTLTQNYTDAGGEYARALAELQSARELHVQMLNREEDELRSLTQAAGPAIESVDSLGDAVERQVSSLPGIIDVDNGDADSTAIVPVQQSLVPVDEQEIPSEQNEMETLKGAVDAVTEAVKKKTEAFNAEEIAVKNAVASEIGELDKLKGKVDSVTDVVNVATSDNQEVGLVPVDLAKDNKKARSGSASGGRDALFDEKVRTAITSLLKYKTTLQEANQLHGDLEDGINSLYQEIIHVSDKADLSTWNEHFKQFKNASSIMQTLIKDYEALGKIQAKADAESDTFKREQLLDDASILRDRIAVKQVDVNVDDDRFDLAYQRSYNITRHELQQKEELAQKNERIAKEEEKNSRSSKAREEEKKRELEEQKRLVNELIPLYKKLGEAKAKSDADLFGEVAANQAKQDYQDIRAQIKQKRRSLKMTGDARGQLTDAYNTGRSNATDSQRVKILKETEKHYEKLGKLRAQVEASNDSGKAEELRQLEETIRAENEILQINQQQNEELRRALELKTQAAYENEKKILNERKKDKDFKKEVKESQAAAKVNRARTAIDNADDTLASAKSIDGLSDDQIAKLEAYKNKLDQLKQKYDAIRNSDGVVKEKDQVELINQTRNVNQLTKEIGELIAEYNRLSGDNVTELGENTLGANAGWADYKQKLTEAVQAATDGKATITGFDAATNTLTYTVKTGKYEFTEYTAALRQLDNQFVSVQGSTKKLEAPLDRLKRKMSEILTYFGGSSIIYRGISEVRRGIQYVREIDSALTELKKVTDETEESYDRFLKTASKTAGKVGSTIKEIVSSTADWARLGYSMEEAAGLAESTSVLLNVSEFSSIEDATGALTSTLQAFSFTADQSMNVVDVLNEVGNNFAISSDGIATALQDSASSLMAANNSYEQAVALIAAANRVVQDPNSVGSALRTISLRLRGTSVKELEEAGEDTTGAITSQSKLRGKIKSLSGVDILTDTGAYKSTYDILLEISKVWKEMSDIDQAALLEILAGKNRANTAAAILSNTKDLEEAYASALDAQGSAYAENEKYLESIQGRINLFNNALQTLWNNILSSDLIKSVVSWGTNIIQSLDTVHGKILAIVKAVAILMAYKKVNPLDWVEKIGTTFNVIKDTGIKSYISSLLGIGTATKVVTAETLANTIATETNSAAKAKQIFANAGLSTATGVLTAEQKEQVATQILAAATAGTMDWAIAKNIISMLGYSIATDGATFSLQALDTTTKSFMASNPVGWILAIVSVVVSLVFWLSTTKSETEKLQEELSGLKSELRDITSELESVNSELETTRSRMSELLAMDSLSFAEQEELDNLRKQNDELQREIDLLELRQKQKQKETAKKFVETMTSGSEEQYYDDGSKASWWSDFGLSSSGIAVTHISESEAIDVKIQKYKDAVDELADIERQIIDAGGEDTKQGKKLKKRKDNIEKEMSEIQAFIQDKTSQWNKDSDGLEYFIGDDLEDWQKETNAWLDYIDNVEDKWAIVSGENTAKTNAINRIFNKEEYDNASKTIDLLVEKLKQNPGDSNIINQIRQQCQLAEEDLQAVGLSIDDAVDSFTMFSSGSSFDTVDKKIKELRDASKKFESLLHNNTFEVDGERIELQNLFDKEGKIIQTQLSKLFKDTDEQTRKEITDVLEEAYDTIKGGLDDGEIEQLTAKLGFKFSRQIMETQKKELAGNTIELFPGLKDEISGIIDTFDELVKSVGSVVDALDALDQARAEEAYSGSVSLETLSKLMASTENYADLIEVDETGAIKLATNAQEILVQQKIDAIKKNAELALADAELTLQEAIHAEQTYTKTGPAQEFLRSMTMEVGGAVAFVSSLWSDLTSGNWDGAWDRATAARNNSLAANKSKYAAEAASASAAVADAQKRVENAEKMNKIAQGLTPDNIQTRYSSDKASGGTDNAKDAAEKKADDALEAVQKQYERKIKNLENQQTFIENEIQALEENEEGVSRSYYEKQIQLEQDKIDLYEQEREALKKLDMTDEVADALWEVEHAIQESTLRMIEFRKSIIELYDTAFENIGKAYDDKNQLYDDRKAYIEGYAELLELDGELPSVQFYESLMEQEELARDNNIAKLNSLQDLYDQLMESSNPFEAGTDSAKQWAEDREKEAIAMEAEMRATEKAIQDNDIALAQFNKDLKELYLTGWDKVMEAFGNKGTYYDNQLNFIDSYISRLESLNVDVEDAVYDKLIQVQQDNQQRIQEQIDFATGELNTIGEVYGTDSQEYFDKYNEIVELEQERYEGQTKIIEWEQKIIENRFAEFDQLLDRINDGVDELKNVANLISDEDVAFEDGTWTKEGITQLGLLYQEMEISKNKVKEYNDEIAALEALYKSGAISEQAYYERLQTLKSGLWDAIDAYDSAEDSIIDLNEARIDMIEDGLNKEIDAYSELIQLKKDELDAERD